MQLVEIYALPRKTIKKAALPSKKNGFVVSIFIMQDRFIVNILTKKVVTKNVHHVAALQLAYIKNLLKKLFETRFYPIARKRRYATCGLATFMRKCSF